MDDQELLDYVEQELFEVMLNGCDIDSHLGYTKYDTASWQVALRADQVARLLDMAKARQA